MLCPEHPLASVIEGTGVGGESRIGIYVRSGPDSCSIIGEAS